MSARSFVLSRASSHLIAVAALALAVAPLCGQTTSSADPDTMIYGEQQQHEEPTLWLAPVKGNIDLMGTYSHTRTSSSGGTDSDTKERHFEESLTLYTNGYIVHPNLVDLRLSITGGLDQDHFDSDQGSNSSNGTVYGWDISATFLRNQPMPLTLYTRREEGTFDVPFGATQRTTTTTYGAILEYHASSGNSRVEAYHEEDTQTDSSTNGLDLTQNRDVVTGSGDARLTENQTLTWNFNLQDATYDSSTNGVKGNSSTNTQSGSASLSHNVNFGDNNRQSLTSALSYAETTGTPDSSDLRWNEHLHLYHTPTFETNYDYLYETLTYGNNSVDRQVASMDARHQLYKSLTTVGTLRWEDDKGSNQETQIYAANLLTNYQKLLANGTFYADLQLGYQQQDLSGSGDVPVVNQPVAFIGVNPIAISQPNAIPSSVLLRDATTGRIYVEGTDYTVNSTPVGMEIDRVLGGNILAGQPLLLNYDYAPQDASEIDTNTYGIGSRYQITKGPLAGFAPYARFFAQDQTIKGGTAEPNNVRDYTLGLLYQRGDLTLRGERQWYDSTAYPFDAWRYEARLNHSISSETSVAATAIYTDTQYHDPDERTRDYSLNASLTQRVSTRLNISVFAAYAHVDTDTGGQTVGIEEGLQADWNYRDTQIYVRLRNSTLNSDTSNQEFQFAQVGLKRSF